MTAHTENLSYRCQYCAADCPVEFGTCHCGCGQKTSIAKTSRKERGDIKGRPIKYATGHTSNVGHRPILAEGLCICRNINCGFMFGYCHCGCGKNTRIAKYTFSMWGWIQDLPKPFLNGHKRVEKPKLEDATPFKIEDVYCRIIPLTQGQYVIVCESDYKWLMHWNWFAAKGKNGYYAMRFTRGDDGRQHAVTMHREILGLRRDSEVIGDHINSNTLDCRRANLREANHAGNARNRKMQKNNTSGFKGVCFDKSRHLYAANIRVDSKLIHLGYRTTAEEAYSLYCEASPKYHGEFSRLQ